MIYSPGFCNTVTEVVWETNGVEEKPQGKPTLVPEKAPAAAPEPNPPAERFMFFCFLVIYSGYHFDSQKIVSVICVVGGIIYIVIPDYGFTEMISWYEYPLTLNISMDSGQVQHASQACQCTTKACHQIAQQGWGKSSCERARKYHVFLQEENMTHQTVLNWPVKAAKHLQHFFVSM